MDSWRPGRRLAGHAACWRSRNAGMIAGPKIAALCGASGQDPACGLSAAHGLHRAAASLWFTIRLIRIASPL